MKFRIGGTIADTDKATHWKEATFHDGKNWISKATGGQWTHQDLYCSKKGRYYLTYSSQCEGSTETAEFIAPEEAARWLLLNNHALPDGLRQYEDQVSE